MKELDRNAFPELTAEYLKERKIVTGYTVHGPNDPDGYESCSKLDVHWVWAEHLNGAAV